MEKENGRDWGRIGWEGRRIKWPQRWRFELVVGARWITQIADEEGDEPYCIVCEKSFKSLWVQFVVCIFTPIFLCRKTKENHEKSKAHKLKLAELKKHLKEEDAALLLEGMGEVDDGEVRLSLHFILSVVQNNRWSHHWPVQTCYWWLTLVSIFDWLIWGARASG